MPPYPISSAPVVCGGIADISLIMGTTALIWLKLESDSGLSAESAYNMDYAFLFFLGLVGLTGMLTLVLRERSLVVLLR
jgi:hypothetical protein